MENFSNFLLFYPYRNRRHLLVKHLLEFITCFLRRLQEYATMYEYEYS